MEPIIIASTITSVATAYWILTSARFRKDMGRNISDTITVHAQSMVANAKFSSAKSKLDAIQELQDDGLTRAIITQHITDFDEMFLGTTSRTPKEA